MAPDFSSSAARALAFFAAPVMPDFADHRWRALGYEGSLWDQVREDVPPLVPAGQRLGSFGEAYFPQVRDLLAS